MEPNAAILALVLLGLALALVTTVLRRRSVRRRGGKLLGPRSALRRELVRRVRGDSVCAERLLHYERERAPEVSETALVRRALERLERDRRR
jgi:hypothetical protein